MRGAWSARWRFEPGIATGRLLPEDGEGRAGLKVGTYAACFCRLMLPGVYQAARR